MIKECPVLRNNDYCTLVKFGDTLVQLPSIKKEAKTVKVEYKDNRYTVVDGEPVKEVVPEKVVEMPKVEEVKEESPKKAKRVKKKEIEETVIE